MIVHLFMFHKFVSCFYWTSDLLDCSGYPSDLYHRLSPRPNMIYSHSSLAHLSPNFYMGSKSVKTCLSF